MRNLKPIQLLILGSVVIALLSMCTLLSINLFIGGISFLYIIISPIIIGAGTYIIFNFLIERFITHRIRVLYRSIRKGKFGKNGEDTFVLREDPISNAEKETKRWTDERIAEISKLKEQEEFRREFLGNLAHELKTPVFSIQGYILTLLDGGLEDQSINRNFLERASKATDRMTAILEDLDQIAKMEADKIQLDYSSFDIKELVQDIFDDLEIKAKDKNIVFTFARDFGSIFVYADRVKIGQVITNLLANSISYGKEEGITSVRFYEMDGIVTVEVSDDGLGIAQEEIPRLFERFYRVEKSRNRHAGGSGLGLAIVKHIIEAHRQTINVRSTINVGSTFTFSIDKARRN